MKFNMMFCAALAVAAFSAPASAAVVFNLSNVHLVDGGQLTGTVTTSDDLSTLLDFSIVSTPKSSVHGNFAGATYTLADATYTSWNPALGLSALFLQSLSTLSLYVADPLSATGASLAAASNEVVWGKGTRWAVSGELVAQQQPGLVPEAATWAMMLAGFGLVGLSMRRRVVSGEA